MSANHKLDKNWIFILSAAGSLIASFLLDGYVLRFFTYLRESFRSNILDLVMGIFSSYLIAGAVLVLYLMLLVKRRDARIANLALGGFAATFLISFLIKVLFARARPSPMPDIPLLRVPDFSFPSMHAALAFSTLPFVKRHFKRQSELWMAGCCLVAFSRLYFSVHYLSDVVGGILLGLAVGGAFLRWEKRK